MPADDGRDIVIVSDLHVSSGYNRRTGTYDRNEDFFYDAAFGRFIDSLIRRSQTEPRRWRLVILGDFADFLQVPTPANRTAGLTSSATATAKLEVIARGHAELFAALARFIHAGHLIDMVIGNHDIEFIWPEVQARFKALVSEQVGQDVSANINFYPWIYYVPGMVYAEHGQQYDRVNSFTTLLQPFLPSRPNVLELPLGSFFVLYLFNYIERIDPFADNVRPVTRYLLWALRVHPIVALSTLGYHVRFFFRVLRKTSNLTAAEQAARRESYRREALQAYAAEIGLPADLIDELDRMAAVPALSNRWRQLEALLFGPLLSSLPTLAAFAALYQALQRLRPGTRSFVTLLSGLLGLVWRERRLLRPATQSGSYMWVAAQQIHQRLTRVGADVPAYVFGHTHTAEQAPFAQNDEAPRYFNTGTWTPLVPQAFELLGTRERFTLVQITRDPTDQIAIARLLVWNDAAGRAEPLPLLM